MIAFRVDNEHDHYITLRAHFLATSFNKTLQQLVRMKLPGK